VIDAGVTVDPWSRFRHRKSTHKYGDNIKMIIVMQCSEENIQHPIRTPFQFGRVVEYMLFSFADDFNLRDGAKPGDSNRDDPNLLILSQVMLELKAEVNDSLDVALEKADCVDSSVNYF
jgi:hypothetical protein